jgi:hypothetical protein
MVLLTTGSTFGEKPEKVRHETGGLGHPRLASTLDPEEEVTGSVGLADSTSFSDY